MAYTSPGVYVSEGPFATAIVTGPTTTAAAFLGTALRGPTVPTLVDSWGTYKALFGDLSSAYDLGYAVYHYFANGGRTAYIARVAGAGASSSAATVTGSYGNSSQTVFTIGATNVGQWGNVLTAEISGGLVTGSTPTFNIVVKNNGNEVERWSELSLNLDNSRFISNVINTYSTYIKTYNVASLAGASYSITSATATLSGGTDGSSLTDDTNGATQTSWSTTLTGFDSVQGQLLFNLVGKSNSTIVNNAISYVENRENSFLIIDPDATATSSTSALSAIAGYSISSYVAVYYPMLKMSNPATSGTAALRNTYPGGALAGLYNRVDTERGVSKAPAGYAYDIRGCFGLVNSFTESEIGTLYNANINTLKGVPGAGVIVNGARTLKKTDITKYIPVRRSLNYIKSNAEALTQFAVFEPNGERLWADISARLANFLSTFWSQGGLKGRSASEAYYIICNDSNNTNTTMENGEVHVEVGVALQSPAEFIVISVTQFVGGNQVRETF